MGSPVVIDDGGSTRIKHLFATNSNLDSLLGTGGVFQATAADPFVNGMGAFKCHLRVRHHQRDGDQQVHPNGGKDLNQNDTVVIESENGQVTTLNFDGASRCVITLTASAAGIDPIVEARQSNGLRRYIVSNAGSIKKVTHQRPGSLDDEIFNAGATPSIYTMVHLR